MNSFVAVLKELGPVITAATPVLLILVNWYVTSRQTKNINEHSTATTNEVKSAITSATGTFKALPGAKSDGP